MKIEISQNELKRVNIISINGRGSSGKDTQGALIVDETPNAWKYSGGEICRGSETPTGEWGEFYEILLPHRPTIEAGGFVPDGVMMPISQKVTERKIMLGILTVVKTGDLRTEEQEFMNELWIRDMRKKGILIRNYIIHTDLPADQSKALASERYNKAMAEGLPPRKDDHPDRVEVRLDAFESFTRPLLERLRREGRLITVNAKGTIPEVQRRVKAGLWLAGYRTIQHQSLYVPRSRYYLPSGQVQTV